MRNILLSEFQLVQFHGQSGSSSACARSSSGLIAALDVRPIFENVLLFERKGSADFFPGLYGGLYGQNLPYKFKNSYGDFQNRNFEKSHTKCLLELLVPGQI
jgi:hypothetical protein